MVAIISPTSDVCLSSGLLRDALGGALLAYSASVSSDNIWLSKRGKYAKIVKLPEVVFFLARTYYRGVRRGQEILQRFVTGYGAKGRPRSILGIFPNVKKPRH